MSPPHAPLLAAQHAARRFRRAAGFDGQEDREDHADDRGSERDVVGIPIASDRISAPESACRGAAQLQHGAENRHTERLEDTAHHGKQ